MNILPNPLFLELPWSWALEPEYGILIFMWSLWTLRFGVARLTVGTWGGWRWNTCGLGVGIRW